MYQFTEWMMALPKGKDFQRVDDFLKKQQLELESSVEYTYAVLHQEEIVATASLEGHVIKCVAVSCRFQGHGLMSKVISHIISEAYRRGISRLMVYTHPKNQTYFSDLGFYAISQVPNQVILMENQKNGISNYISSYKVQSTNSAAIVMNCNPFTLGHRYLIETASKTCETLYVLLVSEDKSEFTTAERSELVKQGTADLQNVHIIPTGDYLISSATFPTYFLKQVNDHTRIHTQLDIQVFVDYFAPLLGITKRFVGEEPFCELTRLYNQTMREVLPQHHIELIILPRKCHHQTPISASYVRLLMKEKRLDIIKDLVPETTFRAINKKMRLEDLK